MTWRSSGRGLAVLVLTIALGAGVGGGLAAGVYGIYRGVRPGLSDPTALAWINMRDREEPGWIGEASLDEVAALREMRGSFSHVAAYSWATAELRWRSTTMSTNGSVVLGEYFRALGVVPQRGRVFESVSTAPDESQVVLSDDIWTRLGRPADLVGATVFLDGEPLTVVGITAPGFHGVDLSAPADFWVPLGPGRRIDPSLPKDGERRRFRRFQVVVRRQPGHSVAEAAAAATVAVHRAELTSDKPRDRFTAVAFSAARGVHPNQAPYLDRRLLGPALGTLFLIAVVLLNAAGILTSRTLARRRELTVRLVLGATRRDLLLQLLQEVTVVVALALVPAVALAALITRVLPTALFVSFHGASIQPPLALSVGLVVTVTTLLAVAACFGSVGIISTTHLEAALREEGTTAGVRQRGYAIQLLVVAAQAAASTALLAALVSLFVRIQTADAVARRVVDVEHLAVVDVHFATTARAPAVGQARLDDLVRRLRSLPSVSNGAVVTGLPIRPEWMRTTFMRWPLTDASRRARLLSVAYVSPGFFETMKRPPVAGREFADTDRPGAPAVVMLSASAAQLLGVGRAELGTELSAGDSTGAWRVALVGIVPDLGIPDSPLAPQPTVYFPIGQLAALPTDVSIVLSSASLSTVLAGVREMAADHRAGSEISVSAGSLATLIDRADAGSRFALTLMVPLVVTALLMALIGVFGVVRGVVQRRTREVGIRLTLGSSRARAVLFVLRHTVVAVAGGLGIGVVAALVASTLLDSSEAWRISPFAFGLAILIVGVGAGGAMLVPALRFFRSEPADLLRLD